MVHIMAMNDINTATPSGQSVPLVIVPHTSDEEWNLGVLLTLAGIIIRTIISAIMLKVEPQEFRRASQSVGMLEIRACIIWVC